MKARSWVVLVVVGAIGLAAGIGRMQQWRERWYPPFG